MTTVTMSTTTRDSAGSLTLYKITFTGTVANAATYTQIFPGAIAYWTNSSAAGSGVAYVASTGVFTFYMASTAACQLFVLCRD